MSYVAIGRLDCSIQYELITPSTGDVNTVKLTETEEPAHCICFFLLKPKMTTPSPLPRHKLLVLINELLGLEKVLKVHDLATCQNQQAYHGQDREPQHTIVR